MKKKETHRTCIVTNIALNKDELIRFVVGPGDEIVPDLREKLPGRGVWVTNSKKCVEQAVKNNCFAARFRKKVKAGSNLAHDIENYLLADIVRGLSIARKSGLVTIGFSKVDSLARNGEIKILFHARDGRDDGLRKIKSALNAGLSAGLYKKGIPVPFERLSSSELDGALGTLNTVHAALQSGGMTTAMKMKIERLNKYTD